MPTAEPIHDLVVVGGGAMGLFTAYHASRLSARVAVVERGHVGDPATASYGLTRSFRSDYLDAGYARLADEALRLWGEFERRAQTEVLVRCGCLNIAKASITPDLAETYAQRSHETLARIGLAVEELDAAALRSRFPYLDADLGRLAVDAGVVNLSAVREALTAALEARGVPILESTETTAVGRDENGALRLATDAGELATRALVVAAGHGTNEVLDLLPGNELQVPITRDRPSEAKYFVPPPETRAQFTSDAMPVVAYLDTGVYCHPIVEGLIDAVKIGYYNPPDLPQRSTAIGSIAGFVAACMPGLAGAAVRDVEGVDQCDYDLVADDEFVLGPVPGVPGAYVGVGWRGTGYKFAPWIGRVLAELAVQEGTVYDIGRFDPARFAPRAASAQPVAV